MELIKKGDKLMSIYERIKALRLSKNMSQQELARLVGYEGRSAISKVENGERDISQSMIVKYAEALGVTPSYLLYGDEEEEGTDKNGYARGKIKNDLLSEYVVFHRDGKNLKVKFNEEQQRIFDALLASASVENTEE